MARRVLLFILIPLALLLVLGLVMQGSISPVMPKASTLGEYFHLKKQMAFVSLGILIMITGTFIDYRLWKRLAVPIYFLAIALLILCYVPMVSKELNGARRWLRLGVDFQPSEFAKLALIIVMAAWSSHYEIYQKTFLAGFLYPMLIIGSAAVLIAGEVDLGNAALLGLASCSVLFVGGTRVRYLLLAAVAGVLLAVAVINFVPKARERLGRLTAFTDLQKSSSDDGMQQYRSIQALGAGGDTGVGLGASQQKHRLPYANSDFIFPIIGEEMGLVGTVSVVFSYIILCLGGGLVAMHAADRFGRLLAFGLVVLIGSQAMLHIGVCVGSLPNKGTALPFISAGGTNIVILLFSIGLLCSIYRKAGTLKE